MREKNVLRKKVFFRKIKRCKIVFVFESEKRCCFPKSNPFVGENQVVKKFFFYKWKKFIFKFLFENQAAPPPRRDLIFKKQFENKIFPFVENKTFFSSENKTFQKVYVLESEKQCSFPKSSPFVGENQMNFF